jgi:MFS family permease
MYAREKEDDEEDSIEEGFDDRQRWSPATQSVLLGQNATATSTQARWISKPFVRLLATNMAFGFSMSCFYLLPKHLTVTYAATPGTIGAVMGIFGLTCVLIVPWLGRVVNGLGLARTIYLSLALMATCSFAFALLASVGPAMLLLRALQGLATGGIMTAAVAMVCELAPTHKLGQAMGLAGAASLIMNAIAPAVAEPIGARYGFAWVFTMSGLAALLGFAIARTLPRRAQPIAEASPIAIPRRARTILLALGLSGVGFNVVMTFLAPLAMSRGVATVSGFFAAYTLAALAMRILGHAWTDRLGLRRTVVLAMILYGAAITSIAGVGPRSMVALGLVFGLAHGALFPALMALLFHDTAPAARAKLAAFSNGVMNLGMLTVLGFGQLANHFGLATVFVMTGLLVAASALLRGGSSSS